MNRSLDVLVRAFFPHFCARCRDEGGILCDECRLILNVSLRGVFCCPGCGRPSDGGLRCPNHRCRFGPVAGLVAAAPYANAPLRELLHEYKYEGVDEARRAVLGLWGSFVAGRLSFIDSWQAAAVMPVPMHRWRLAARGFNQADELAGVVSEITGLPMCREVLIRRWRWRRQAELAGRSSVRSANADGSFAARSSADCPESVILVDDVATTGATLNAAAAALHEIGVSRVWGLTLLRG